MNTNQLIKSKDSRIICFLPLQGDYSFMLYDASVQYLLVCRAGVNNKLYWGLDDMDNSMLLIASVKANLTEFPAGCAFEVCRVIHHDG